MDYFTGKALEYDAEELDDEYEDEDEDDNVTAAAGNVVFVMGDASGVGSPWCLA